MRADPLDLSRRDFLGVSVAALTAAALPLVRDGDPLPPALPDATLQAFYDTVLPGRRVARTASGRSIHPDAIAGADPEPGAVEADALLLGEHPLIGFDALAPAFLADLELRAVPRGGPFLTLPHEQRVAACIAGLDFGNPLRIVWEAAAAVAYTAFCTSPTGYAVLGLPPTAPAGYEGASYGRVLATERTTDGNLP